MGQCHTNLKLIETSKINKMEIQNTKQYSALVNDIGTVLNAGKQKAIRAILNEQLNTNWEIGRHIVEFEQQGSAKSDYKSYLLDKLSVDLTISYGKGFSKSNLVYIRKLYLTFPIGETLSHQLSWSHYFEILKINNELERGFYIKQSENENWGIRELKRQIKTSLFERLALSKDKEGIIKLSQKGQIIETPQDIIKEPLILEFLNLSQTERILEGELEQQILQNLQQFILELGKGFAFIGSQVRVPVSNRNFRVDLVFYHRILKCFVLIDLKSGEVNHEDIGQMNLYLNYYKKEQNVVGDNEPIGIVLGASKDEVYVEYSLTSINNSILVNSYELYLPNKELLQNELRKLIADYSDK